MWSYDSHESIFNEIIKLSKSYWLSLRYVIKNKASS